MTTTTFSIAPLESGSWVMALLMVPIALGLGFGLYVVVASITGSRSARFEVSDAALTLRGDMYGRTIPRSSLYGAGVRIVNLDAESRLRPVRRTLGTALPGYRAGWFRLADGEKALLYVTDTSRVVYVPTTVGYSLLLSSTDPDGLASSLRASPP